MTIYTKLLTHLVEQPAKSPLFIQSILSLGLYIFVSQLLKFHTKISYENNMSLYLMAASKGLIRRRF